MLLDHALAGELSCNDDGLEMVAAACRVSDLDATTGKSSLDHDSDLFGIHGVLVRLIPDSARCGKGGYVHWPR